MLVRHASTGWLAVLLCGIPCLAGDGVRLNQIQVIGTHNSYHVAPAPSISGLIGAASQTAADALDYTHRPLPEQFSDLGIRQIELDLFADPRGGHYAEPTARKILKGLGKDPGPDPDEGGKLQKPGLKIFHVQDVDYRSTVSTFADALLQVRDWSNDHPRHVPILVLIETKDDPIPALPTRPIPFGLEELESIDGEIRAIFEPSRLLTPDDLRGDHASLLEAIQARGWPELDEVRGKVYFALDDEGALRDRYLDGHPALQGRVLFVSVEPDHPAAAWMKVNDPVRDFDRIQRLVQQGFLVRTRADADTQESRKNDPSRREKALASGAQFVSTDFPEPRLELSPYQVRLPARAAARPNPVLDLPDGLPADLESPEVVSPPSSIKAP
ncbi:phosphatidylinositol-specific phospholipase C1-like protein [Tundrisphaera lichenicola]|uniref:phosphatidylinositol-specific phospholipase C1-like protein n=1 Tax=Tundrisphaera lichenicola TaxID=2029860 RepID=UPI003EBD7CF0